MDLGTDYCYAGVPLVLCRTLTRGLLGCCIYILYFDFLLSARCLLSEGGAEPFVQAGDNACQEKGYSRYKY